MVERNPRQLDSDSLRDQTRSLRALARAMVGDEHLAEDVVQDTFVRAIERPAKPGWPLTRWLAGITRNRVRERDREDKRRDRRERVAAKPEALPADDTLERVDLLRHLLDQVKKLAEPYRSTILLRYFDGLSPRDVARRHGVPHATVRTRLKRGIEMLREQMDEAAGGDRAKWVAPLLPFISVPDPGPLTALGEQVAHAAEQGALVLTAKKKVLGGAALVLAGGIAATALWPTEEIDRTGAEDQGSGLAVVGSSDGDEREPGPTASRLEVDRKVDDVAERRIAPGAPTVMVRGVVRDDAGGPIAGATVKLWPSYADDKAKNEKASAAKTELRGKLAWRKPGPMAKTARDGSYSVVIRAPVVEALDCSIGAFAGGRVAVLQTLQIMPDQPSVRLDFELRTGFVITGRVTDAGGAAVAGATVWTWREEEHPVETDANGEYRLDHVDPLRKHVWVEASAAGYIAQWGRVDVKGSGATQDFTLKRGSAVRGFVYDPAGRPLAGAAVHVQSGKLGLDARSDERGFFQLVGVTPGERALVVSHEEHVAHRRTIDVPPSGGLELRIDMSVGATIAGIVRDPGGKPVVDAHIQLVSRKEKALNSALSDTDGAFEIRGVPPTTRWIRVSAKGYVAGMREARAGDRDLVLTLTKGARLAGRVVDGRDGSPVTEFTVRFFRARPAGKGEQTVTKGKKAESKAGIEIPWGRRRIVSSEGAWDSGDGNLPVGFEVGVEIRASGFAPVTIRATAAIDPKPNDLRTELLPGTRVLGQVVVGASGAPVAGATVTVVRDGELQPAKGKRSGEDGPEAKTDAAGRFDLRDVAPGVLQLAVDHPEWGLVLHPLRIAPGTAQVHETVRVDSRGWIAGVVLDGRGKPVEDADIRLSAVAVEGVPTKAWRARSDARGRFTIRLLPDGVYRLARAQTLAWGKATEGLSRYVRIAGAKRHEVVLSAAGGATLVGTVRSTGAVPEHVWISLVPEQTDATPWEHRRTPRQTVATKGAFRVEALGPARYRIEATAYDDAADAWVRGTGSVLITGTGEQRVEVALTAARK